MLNLVLIAGGMGTRMLTHFPNTPKLLLPLMNDQTILSQLVEDIDADEYYFCLGSGFEQVTQAIVDINKPCYHHVEKSPKGTYGALSEIVGMYYQQMPEKLFVLLGDLYSHGFKEIQKDEIIRLLADDSNYYFFVKDEFRSDSDRIAVNSENEILHLYRKNENCDDARLSSRSLCGAYLINKKDVLSCPLTTGDLVTDFLPYLIDLKSIKARLLKFDLLDVGTIRRYDEVVSGEFRKRQKKAIIFNLFDIFQFAFDITNAPINGGKKISKSCLDLLRMVNKKGGIAIATCNAEEVSRLYPSVDTLTDAIENMDRLLIADGLWLDEVFLCTCLLKDKEEGRFAEDSGGCKCNFADENLIEYLRKDWNCDAQNILSFSSLSLDAAAGVGCEISQYDLSLLEGNTVLYSQIERFLSQ